VKETKEKHWVIYKGDKNEKEIIEKFEAEHHGFLFLLLQFATSILNA
jgi:hypothetical protein